MAIDKIKPLKLENSASGGTQIDMFPTETNPAQDYIATKGIALEGNEIAVISGSSGVMSFQDSVQTTSLTLTQLITALNNTFNNTSNGFTSTNAQAAIEEAKNSARGQASRYAITMFAPALLTAGSYFTYGNTGSNSTPLVIPEAATLIGYSYAATTTISINTSFNILKNGTIIATQSMNGSASGFTSALSTSLAAGDKISMTISGLTLVSAITTTLFFKTT